MKDINISPSAQGVLLLALLAAAGAMVAAQFPELQRYLKIRSM